MSLGLILSLGLSLSLGLILSLRLALSLGLILSLRLSLSLGLILSLRLSLSLGLILPLGLSLSLGFFSSGLLGELSGGLGNLLLLGDRVQRAPFSGGGAVGLVLELQCLLDSGGQFHRLGGFRAAGGPLLLGGGLADLFFRLSQPVHPLADRRRPVGHGLFDGRLGLLGFVQLPAGHFGELSGGLRDFTADFGGGLGQFFGGLVGLSGGLGGGLRGGLARLVRGGLELLSRLLNRFGGLVQGLRGLGCRLPHAFGHVGGDVLDVGLPLAELAGFVGLESLLPGGLPGLLGDPALGFRGPIERLGGPGQLVDLDTQLPPPGIGQCGLDFRDRPLDGLLSLAGRLPSLRLRAAHLAGRIAGRLPGLGHAGRDLRRQLAVLGDLGQLAGNLVLLFSGFRRIVLGRLRRLLLLLLDLLEILPGPFQILGKLPVLLGAGGRFLRLAGRVELFGGRGQVLDHLVLLGGGFLRLPLEEVGGGLEGGLGGLLQGTLGGGLLEFPA